MSDRDRLIELLKPHVSGTACLCESGSCELTSCRDCKARRLADYLISNGVIVPPCNVGDTVYYIAGKKVYKSKCHAITQHKNGLQIHLYDYDGDNARYSTKDVFLTKEEAEKALAERRKDNA